MEGEERENEGLNEQESKSIDIEQLKLVWERQKAEMGEEHETKMKTMECLAKLYQDSELYDDALSIYREKLSIEERLLLSGESSEEMEISHFQTKNSVACIYFEKGDYPEAIRLLTINYEELSETNHHRLIIQTMVDLASAYEKSDQMESAEALYSKAFNISTQVFGFGIDPTVIIVFARLTSLYEKQRRYTEAEEIARLLIRNSQEELDLDPLTTAACTVYAAQAKDLVEEEKFSEAEGFIRFSLEGRRKLLGVDHELTLLTMNSALVIGLNLGKLEESAKIGRECLELCEEKLGKDHEVTLITLQNLYTVLSLQGNHDEGITLGLDCLNRRINLFGEFSVETWPDRANLAAIYADKGNVAEIRKMYTPLINHLKQQHGEENDVPNPTIEKLESDQEQLLAKALTVSMGVPNLVIAFKPKDKDNSISSLSDTTLNPILAAEMLKDAENSRKSMSIRKSSLEIDDSMKRRASHSKEIEKNRIPNSTESDKDDDNDNNNKKKRCWFCFCC